MGTDCKIKVDGEWNSLDRWYVFWNDFKVGTTYSRSEALKIIRKMKRRKVGDYDRYWLDEARRIIKEAKQAKEIMIVDEHRLEEYGYPSFDDAWLEYQNKGCAR